MDGKNTTLQPVVHFCIILCIVLLTSLEANAHMWRRQADAGPGTTKNIAEIFQGRCHEHIQCLQTDQCNRRPKVINCTAIWIEFLGAFQHQNPCNTSADVYDDVLTMAVPITPDDQTLFWSGLLDAALNVARVSMQYRILEESLPGYMANQLVWCGDDDPASVDGINYEKCPEWGACENETSFRFWQAASREFSRQATGKVSVALNAHRDGGAFRNTSVFATVELPNLNPDTVTMVEILLVPDITSTEEGEKCGKGSIKELERRLDVAGLPWICTYDPLEFRYIQCTTLENPLEYKACRGDKQESQRAKEETIIVGAVLGGVILILIIVVAILLVQSCKRLTRLDDSQLMIPT
ncbi:ADP-ribosyl cyclase/cyclic ADP-ribose hydrolase-like [Amphiura filiformis]|uniref:ADP-ribosyl cyclase/cyclic ADP-ribose hydrolase-like n=1 Tax=Amphiura filiformis TaxID=82378 RepID=UPI003B221784